MNPRGSIAGDWQPAPGGRLARVTDPISGELYTDVADGTVEDGLADVSSAERARLARAAIPQTFCYRRGLAVDPRTTRVAGNVIDLAGRFGSASRSSSIRPASAPIW